MRIGMGVGAARNPFLPRHGRGPAVPSGPTQVAAGKGLRCSGCPPAPPGTPTTYIVQPLDFFRICKRVRPPLSFCP